MVSGDRAAPASDCDKHYEIHLDCRWTADIVVNDQSADSTFRGQSWRLPTGQDVLAVGDDGKQPAQFGIALVTRLTANKLDLCEL